MTYLITSPAKAAQPPASSEIKTDETDHIVKTDPRLAFLTGWHIDRAKAWARYRGWRMEEKP